MLLAVIYIIAFITGAIVMSFEMLGSRYLNPYFGSRRARRLDRRRRNVRRHLSYRYPRGAACEPLHATPCTLNTAAELSINTFTEAGAAP